MQIMHSQHSHTSFLEQLLTALKVCLPSKFHLPDYGWTLQYLSNQIASFVLELRTYFIILLN